MMKLIVLFSVAVCALAAEIPLGKPKLDGRIVGGRDVDIRDFGWQVSLHRGGHFCGGSIISNTWILTAAHCFDNTSPSGLSVRVGSSLHGTGGSVYGVSQITKHPRYNSQTQDNDVALLRLSTSLTLNGQTVRIAPMASRGSNTPAGTTVTASGWGYIKEGGPMPSKLQAVSVPIVDQNECSRKYSQYGGVTPQMICAGFDEGGKDSCQGDSGGPLVDGKGTLVGVVSWGVGCARRGIPGVYARVASPLIRDFISQTTGL